MISVQDPGAVTIGQPKRGTATDKQLEAAQARWRGAQPIVYIGKAKTLRKRLKQFYMHKYGERAPHAGGQSILLLHAELSICWHAADAETEISRLEHQFLSTFEKQAGFMPFGNRMKATKSKASAVMLSMSD